MIGLGNTEEAKTLWKKLAGYHRRSLVETAFDAFKNTLQADRTYMQNDQPLEGWIFINYLALIAYWRILKLLVSKNCYRRFQSRTY